LAVDVGEYSVPVHLVNGAWGLVAAGLFSTESGYSDTIVGFYSDGSSRAKNCAGILYGGSGLQLAANVCFVLAVISWSCVCMFTFLYIWQHTFHRQYSEIEPLHGNIENSGSILYKEKNDARTIRDNSDVELRLLREGARTNSGLLSGGPDEFETACGYSWDVALILPAPSDASRAGGDPRSAEDAAAHSPTGPLPPDAAGEATVAMPPGTARLETINTSDESKKKCAIEVIQLQHKCGS
jgi:hypothetical protein